MSDALLSPAVGGSLWFATALTIGGCARKMRNDVDDRRVPLMGVLGAFVFAAQMINFTIPGTGSSGHLGGGMILAILLGPCAAFLVMTSILVVQALFFADGGLLALGANIFNLGAFPAFLAYPLVYLPLAGDRSARRRRTAAAILAAVIGLQIGSLGVVLQTVLSGVSEVRFTPFALLMQPIHLAIGVVEGIVTAAVVEFVARAQPDLLSPRGAAPATFRAGRPLVAALLLLTLAVGGVFSWFASERPDGLEWSIAGALGGEEPASPSEGLIGKLGSLQERTSVLPDYGFRDGSETGTRAGTSVSGLVGAALTLLFSGVVGWLLRRRAGARG